VSFIQTEARKKMSAIRGPAPRLEREPVVTRWRASVVLGEDSPLVEDLSQSQDQQARRGDSGSEQFDVGEPRHGERLDEGGERLARGL
jgi:hypothetical protein